MGRPEDSGFRAAAQRETHALSHALSSLPGSSPFPSPAFPSLPAPKCSSLLSDLGIVSTSPWLPLPGQRGQGKGMAGSVPRNEERVAGPEGLRPFPEKWGGGG